jgi:hypothetical protein
LEHLVAPIEAGHADLVQGRTLPRPDQTHLLGPWSRTMRVEREDGFYQTCNLAYRRHALEQVGGFRTEFGAGAGEDTELAWRAKKAGFRTAFAPEALVHHVVWPSSYRAYLRDRRRWASIVLVVKHHPETRRFAYRRWFYRPSHARLLAGVATLVAAGTVRRWLPPVLAGGAVAAHLVRTRGSGQPAPRRTAHLAQALLADAVEVAHFARASLRHRTLLL